MSRLKAGAGNTTRLDAWLVSTRTVWASVCRRILRKRENTMPETPQPMLPIDFAPLHVRLAALSDYMDDNPPAVVETDRGPWRDAIALQREAAAIVLAAHAWKDAKQAYDVCPETVTGYTQAVITFNEAEANLLLALAPSSPGTGVVK